MIIIVSVPLEGAGRFALLLEVPVGSKLGIRIRDRGGEPASLYLVDQLRVLHLLQRQLALQELVLEQQRLVGVPLLGILVHEERRLLAQ